MLPPGIVEVAGVEGIVVGAPGAEPTGPGTEPSRTTATVIAVAPAATESSAAPRRRRTARAVTI